MIFGTAKTLTSLCIIVILCASAHALCTVEVVTVRVHVEHAPDGARVQVQLIFEKGQTLDSTEATVEDGAFNIPVEFLTQSHKPVLMGIGEKCDRKPRTVIVRLLKGNQEYDRVSLDFAKDFRMVDATNYMLGSEIVLNGAH
jgi:hypothetical protein